VFRTRCASLIKEKAEAAETKETKKDSLWICCQEIDWAQETNNPEMQQTAGLLKKELERRSVDVTQFSTAWKSLHKT
jgi:hypothetical protein